MSESNNLPQAISHKKLSYLMLKAQKDSHFSDQLAEIESPEKREFEELINTNKFYEYAKIFENYYGTLKKNVDEIILKNDLIFDIDWQGTKQLSKFKNLNLIKIYLITDNKDELKRRLIDRNQNTSEEIEKRFYSFDEDVKHWHDYDYILINKNLEVCFKQIEEIIKNKKAVFTNFSQ